ncbi:MAG: hypothetical protein WDZ41_05830 [Candidatus Babeliales bacterium]
MRKFIFILCFFNAYFGESFAQNFTNSSLIFIVDNTEFLHPKKKFEDFMVNELTLIAALKEKAAPVFVSFSVLKKVIENIDLIKKKYHDLNLEDGWIYKKIDNDFYLLIPTNYNEIPELKNYTSQNLKKDAPLTTLEWLLGLKIDHFEKVNPKTIVNELYPPTLTIDFENSLIQNLSNIFVLNQKYEKAKPIQKKPVWAFYLIGHGSILEKHDRQNKITEEQLMQIYTFLNQVSVLWKSLLEKEREHDKETDFDKKITNIIKQIEIFEAANNLLQQVSKIINIRELATEPLKKMINLVKEKKISLKTLVEKMHNRREDLQSQLDEVTKFFRIEELSIAEQKMQNKNIYNIFAGLSMPNFQNFLSFLDTKIKTKILCFLTCYAGGESLNRLYQAQKNTVQKIYNYIIASAASAEVEAVTSIEFLNFNKFFRALRTDKPIDFEETLNYVFGFYLPEEKEIVYPGNLPLLKLPGLEWVSMVDIPEKIVSIGKSLARSRSPHHSLNVSQFFAGRLGKKREKLNMIYPEVILLYAEKIPFELRLSAPPGTKAEELNFPTFISMISGNAVHELVGVNALDFGLWNIIDSSFGGLHPQKMFIIKNLSVKNDIKNWPKPVENQILNLSNVIIFNSIKDPLNQQEKPHDGIYFTINDTFYRSWWHSLDVDGIEKILISEGELENLTILKNDYLTEWLNIAASIRSEKAKIPGSVFEENLTELKKFIEKKPRVKSVKKFNDLSQQLTNLEIALKKLDQILKTITKKI